MKKIADIATALEEELSKKLDALEAQLNSEREARLRLEKALVVLNKNVQDLANLLSEEPKNSDSQTSSEQQQEQKSKEEEADLIKMV